METTASSKMQQAVFDLEVMVDKIGVDRVALCLANVCHLKAEHVLSTWQDKGLAREWTRAAKLLERAHVRLPHFD